MFKAIRWSDHDRYLGPITYAHEPRYRKLGIMLGSGDGGDYRGCRLRISLFVHTIIIALPAIIKPWGERWDSHAREYGFTFVEGALHVHYGPQTHDSTTTKGKVFFYPWQDHRIVRHTICDLQGRPWANLPEWGGLENENGWDVRNVLMDACPVARFEFDDFDGERITATCRIEEREYRRGKGMFRLLYLGRNKTYRSLDLAFSSEVGRRKGSWKGGTVGHSIVMRPGENHEAAFYRYCDEQGLAFKGAPS